jgi:adenylate kinase
MPADCDRFRAIVLLGLPGAGKGTLARKLAATFGMHHVDMGQLLRNRAKRGDRIGRRIHRLQARGDMVPKELVLETLNEHLARLSTDRMLILDGFPRTTGQLAATEDGRVPIKIERAIWLDVPRPIAESRLRERAAHSPRNDDGGPAARQRFALVDDTVEALRREFAARGMLEVVDASRSPDQVFEDVHALIDALLTRT